MNMALHEKSGLNRNNGCRTIKYVDHFSLGTSSTTVRFRNAKVHIYGDGEDEFVVEDRLVEQKTAKDALSDGKNTHQTHHVLTVKRIQSSSVGLQALRGTYTLVALLVFGFLFVFCFQIVLCLVFNMLAYGREHDSFAVVGALLSVPIFLYGIASIMCLGWTFVCETWSGIKLIRILFDWPIAATEWLCFAVFLGIPALSVTTTLFLRLDNWWQVTCSVWVICVMVLMAAFVFSVVAYEVRICCRLIRINSGNQIDSEKSCVRGTIQLMKRALYLAQLYYFSGVRHEWYLVNGDDEPPEGGYCCSDTHAPMQTYTSMYSLFTQLGFNRCCFCPTRGPSQSSWQSVLFEQLPIPTRTFRVAEMREILPIIDRENWSLERMFCRNQLEQMITVTGGRGALKQLQLKSTFVCQVLGSLLIVMIVVALMAWMRMASKAVLLVSVGSVYFCIFPIIRSAMVVSRYLLRQRRRNSLASHEVERFISGDEENMALMSSVWPPYGRNESSEETGRARNDLPRFVENDGEIHDTTLQVWETVRITKPRAWLCYAVFGVEIFMFFAWPLTSLITHGNSPVGMAFAFLGVFSFLRLHFNVASILQELGTLSDIDITQDESSNLREKSRVSHVMGNLGRGPSVSRWARGYGFATILVFFCAYLAATSEYDTTEYKVKGAPVVPGFYYPPRNTSNAEGNLPYQTCKLTKGFNLPGMETVMMLDFAFLATMAYAGPDEAQGLLDTWFGEGRVKDEYKLVDLYRNQTKSVGGVSYKLFSFPDYPEYGVVSIRGSEMTLDWMVNIELWSTAALLQLLRGTMPFGGVVNPILHKLAYVASMLKNSEVRKKSYYAKTTDFVQDALDGFIGGGKYRNIRVTGVSLGAGLAIITGAQTGASTVAISGPNALISRKTFEPPLDVEQINTRVLNVIPERDYVARVDDAGRLTQRIECRAPSHSLFGCHSMWRSLCEFAYQCGSEGRPILCWCVSKYGYPKPQQSGNTSWEEACI